MFGTKFHDSFQFLWFDVGKNVAHLELKYHISVSMYVQNPRKINKARHCVYVHLRSRRIYTPACYEMSVTIRYQQKKYIYDMIPLVLELDAKK